MDRHLKSIHEWTWQDYLDEAREERLNKIQDKNMVEELLSEPAPTLHRKRNE